MDCFHDFCLACDKQSSGPYCSQACRLADLEKANTSAPTSPTLFSTAVQSRLSWSSSKSTTAPGYALQPAYEFHSPTHEERPQTSYFMRSDASQPTEHAASPQRSLTPSSSQTSLSSTTSNTSTTSTAGLSDEARLALQDYFGSFSRAKAAKRRPSLR